MVVGKAEVFVVAVAGQCQSQRCRGSGGGFIGSGIRGVVQRCGSTSDIFIRMTANGHLMGII